MYSTLEYRQESRSGYYRTSAYFLGKLLFDVIPLRAFVAFLYATITYWMIGFKPDFVSYLIYVGNLVLMTWSSAALFVLFGSCADALDKTLPAFGISVSLMLMFSGFIININSIMSWLAWLKYINIIFYSYNTVVANEISGQVFCNPFPDNSTCAIGDDYLDQQGIDFSTRGLWINQIGMACITIGCFTLTYIRLRLLCRLA
ncbi:broad substrate specificity ATP-binding cassette transporter ABCG2-like [Amphiura filiformis]|uniref:broad substrate specificity ATP-binding cassette transporter ABCG2-like n=1 Tax=Amphiura filiformis TaxID=82378 RepID=UPI003B212B32